MSPDVRLVAVVLIAVAAFVVGWRGRPTVYGCLPLFLFGVVLAFLIPGQFVVGAVMVALPAGWLVGWLMRDDPSPSS